MKDEKKNKEKQKKECFVRVHRQQLVAIVSDNAWWRVNMAETINNEILYSASNSCFVIS